MHRKSEKREATALAAMREAQAAGWLERALLIDAGAAAIGGADADKVAARVYDKHFRVMGPS